MRYGLTWINVTTRAHSGKYCCGKTPTRTFADSIPLARGKLFGRDEFDGQGVNFLECQIKSLLSHHWRVQANRTLVETRHQLVSAHVFAFARANP